MPAIVPKTPSAAIITSIRSCDGGVTFTLSASTVSEFPVIGKLKFYKGIASNSKACRLFLRVVSIEKRLRGGVICFRPEDT
jgi:hypothetical protein